MIKRQDSHQKEAGQKGHLDEERVVGKAPITGAASSAHAQRTHNDKT